jgi:outer membrane protein OmpA-like peptidoglycan-associated protein
MPRYDEYGIEIMREHNDYAAGPWNDKKFQIPRGVLLASGLANLVALALLALWVFGPSGTATETETASQKAITDASELPAPDQEQTTAAGGDTAGAPPASAPTASTFTVPVTPDNPEGAAHYAVFTGGKVYLRGVYPSREVADQAVVAAIAVLGPDNVVDEMQIDPAAPLDADYFPVYIQDYVLFEFASADLAPDFLPILDLALIFLGQNPQATITVVARTDAVGSPEFNLDLSSQRAQAVIDYWLSHGVSPEQVVADPRGEDGATDGADAQAAAFDRRVELVVAGLLSGSAQ